MKIVTWTRDCVPELDLTDDGNWMFEDHPNWFNLEVGDQIQYLSLQPGFGTRTYFVIDVCELAETTPIKLVIIEE